MKITDPYKLIITVHNIKIKTKQRDGKKKIKNLKYKR